MILKIVSGFQSGADIAAIDAAISLKFPYGGWVPKGRRTESGPLDVKYIAQEMPTKGYPPRTRKNVIDSDGTVIFTHGSLTGGSALTRKIAIDEKKPWLHCDMSLLTVDEAAKNLLSWIETKQVNVLNVAGRSGSQDAKIYDVVFGVIGQLIKESV